MTGPFGNVEGLLERAFELPVRRLFRVPLQPVELSRAVARAMEGSAQIGSRGLQVANQYVVALHPRDFQAFASWRDTMERELSDYLQQYALQRGWYCSGRPRVAIEEVAGVSVARPRVSASLADKAAAGPATLLGQSPDATAVVPPREPAQRPTAGPALAWLELPEGPAWAVDKPSVQLGRAPDNDLVLADAGVSRYHARIEQVGTGFVLRDLGSSNGTWMSGTRVGERALNDGDSVSLGKLMLRFWLPR